MSDIGRTEQAGPSKGEFKMSSQSPIRSTLVALAAALALSTVAIGAAVGPAQADANPLQVRVYA